MSADRTILATAPLRGPGLDALRELGEVILDPWIDHQPLRLYSGEKLAARWPGSHDHSGGPGRSRAHSLGSSTSTLALAITASSWFRSSTFTTTM